MQDACWSGDLVVEGFSEEIPQCSASWLCWGGDLISEGFAEEMPECA